MDNWTNDYIRIPFKDCGRDRFGADCWGLARIIYQEKLGVDLPSLLFYRDTVDRGTIAGLYENEESTGNWIKIPKGEEKPFDVIVLKILGFPMHIGVVFSKGFMIHCLKGCGTVVVDYNSDTWNKRIVGFYRYACTSK